jgi:hypothetical protein
LLNADEFRRATREAALWFDTEDEPSDEALGAIENESEESLLSLYNNDIDPMASLPPEKMTMDYDTMAVSQLKSELRKRVTGEKVNLIDRLREMGIYVSHTEKVN